MSASNVIAVVQPFVPTYRVPFFNALDEEIRSLGLQLQVWHAQPRGIVAARGNAASGPWSVAIKQHRVSYRRHNLTYRNILTEARGTAAVIHGLASTNLETYGLALDRRVNLMLWGHGRNYTAASHHVDERLERWLIRRSSHVFAYTEAGADHLIQSGLDRSRVTVVRNSTDTRALIRYSSKVASSDVDAICRELQIEGRRVGIFVGAYDEPKNLPLLFAAADQIHARDPAFSLLLAGDGPLRDYVRRQCEERPYARELGRVDAQRLALLGHVAQVMLMPGRVGLVAVDALALGIPVVTAQHNFHAPEVEYLSPSTSLFTPNDASSMADGVISLFEDDERLSRMARACSEAGAALSVESAARNFASGVANALDSRANG